MKSAISIDVAAPAEVVFALARDVERWPRLLAHYEEVRILERRPDGSVVARMIARRPVFGLLGIGLPVAWRSRTWSEPQACRIRFVHQGGATNGMDVTWRIESTGEGCRVTIEHDFRPRFAPWAPFIDRFFTRPIAGRTLATFKAIAEALAGAGAAPATEVFASRSSRPTKGAGSESPPVPSANSESPPASKRSA
jgi:ribosome-associated toxin RatA of RatAB toxin-antitoxin module